MPLTTLGHGAMASGSVLQVQRTRLTSANTQALTQNTVVAITGMSVNITPKFSNSLIRLDAHFFGEVGEEANTFNNMISFMRDTTELHETAVGTRNYGYGTLTRTIGSTDVGTSPESACIFDYDSPSTTSQVTYKLAIRVYSDGSGTDTLAINRIASDGDYPYVEYGISQISATEIKQ
tara:strand:+ start:61 stop:594 length:534 start_codon:yes stop_codon:yes gene_type:complete